MCKVNLFIVGCVKGGTTWLYDSLSNSDSVYCPDLKEPQYFNRSYSPRKHFDHITDLSVYEKRVSSKARFKYRVDGSATYLTTEDAPSLIHKYNPDAKIIIMLRDKVDRAYSHYLMNMREGIENKSLSEAISIDSDYYRYSQYEDGVNKFKKLFSENVLIINFVEIKTPDILISKVCNFLDIEYYEQDDRSERKNHSELPRNKIFYYLLGNDYVRLFLKIFIPKALKHKLRNLIFTQNVPKINEEERKYLSEILKQ